jgi:hypothetical protein
MFTESERTTTISLCDESARCSREKLSFNLRTMSEVNVNGSVSEDHGFKVCRGCLEPQSKVALTALFDGNKSNAAMFQIVGGIDVSWWVGSVKFVEIHFSIRMLQIENDEYFYDALICEQCLNHVKHAYNFRRKIKEFDENYFAPKRFSMETYCKTENLDERQREIDIETAIASDDEVEAEQFTVIEVQSDDEDALEGILFINDSDYEFEPLIEFQEPNKAVDATSETESSPFKCLTCDQSYKSKRALRFHHKKKHEIAEPLTATKQVKRKTEKFQCDFCQKKYSSIASLRQHIIGCHQHPNQFVCCFCEMKFNFKSNHDRHINQHYTNPEFNPKKRKQIKN